MKFNAIKFKEVNLMAAIQITCAGTCTCGCLRVVGDTHVPGLGLHMHSVKHACMKCVPVVRRAI